MHAELTLHIFLDEGRREGVEKAQTGSCIQDRNVELTTPEVVLERANARLKSLARERVEPQFRGIHYGDPALDLPRNEHILDHVVQHVHHSFDHVVYILLCHAHLPFL